MNSSWSYSLETLNSADLNWRFFITSDLEIWWVILKNNRAPVLCYFKRFASCHTCWWIQIGVTVWKLLIQVKVIDFFVPCDLEIWRMTLKNNRAHLLCNFKLCASFHSHRSIQTGITVQQRQIWVKIGDFLVLCDLEIWWMTLKNNRAPLLCYFWPWSFAWTSLSTLVIIPENFMMISWQEHCEKKVSQTDGRADGQTDGQNCS